MENIPISQIGEFGLISRIEKLIGSESAENLIIGIGDDAAVIRNNKNHYTLATCDIQIQDTHFKLEYTTPYKIGRKAVAVNLSDIAAMGGVPQYALISLGLPSSLSLNSFDDLLYGMHDQLVEFKANIIGGNLSYSAEKIIIDITMVGETGPNQPLLRKGARAGDKIYVTGSLGGSAAGLSMLKKYGTNFPDEFVNLVNSHLEPQPRITAGIALAKSGIVNAMIDISDGLVGDLFHISEQSRVGFEIYQEKIPLPHNIFQAAVLLQKDPIHMAVNGGEDYELLFTSNSDPDEINKIVAKTKTAITEIGRIHDYSEGFWITDFKNRRKTIHSESWNHFI